MLKTKRTRGEWRKKHSRRVATFGLKSRVFDGKLVTPEMPWFLGRVLKYKSDLEAQPSVETEKPGVMHQLTTT